MITQPIHAFAKWQVKDGQLSTVLKLLIEVVRESKKEDGNLFYEVNQSNSDPNILILFEGYVDEDALTEHRASAHFQHVVIAKIVPLLEDREVILTTALDLN